MRRLLCLLLLTVGCGGPPADPSPAASGPDAGPPAASGATPAAAEQATAARTCRGGSSSYRLQIDRRVGGPLAGFGAQLNSYLYHPRGHVPAARTAAIESKVRIMAPDHVRIFFDPDGFRSAAIARSFSKTVALAQAAGATVNVTYWHAPYSGSGASFGRTQMQKFATMLRDQIVNQGHTAIRYVTVQNEPNRTSFNNHVDDYVTLYRNLDRALRDKGIRDRIKIIAGDLTRGHPGTRSWYGDWLVAIGKAASVIDGYSFHIYWRDSATGAIAWRLLEARRLVAALPAAERKPLYVTEFGARGFPDGNRRMLRWPGFVQRGCRTGKRGCTRFVASVESAVDDAWFEIAAARLGYRAAVRWDAYQSRYDRRAMYWAVIGGAGAEAPLHPGFGVARLFSHLAPRGWHAIATTGGGSNQQAAGFASPGGKVAVIAVNRDACAGQVRLTGLPGGQQFQVLEWNWRGHGRLCRRASVRSARSGALTVPVARRGVAAVSTGRVGLTVPPCRAAGSSSGPRCGDGVCSGDETDQSCGRDCGCAALGALGCSGVAPAPFGCYCDSACALSGDCCADQKAVCP